MRRIGSISVGSTVDGRARGRQVFPPASPGQEAQNGNDDNENDDETRDGNANGKITLRKANDRRIISSHFCGRFAVFNESVVEVTGLTDVEATVDLDLEIFAIGVIEKTPILIKLKGLPLSASFQQILSIGITDWGLK